MVDLRIDVPAQGTGPTTVGVPAQGTGPMTVGVPAQGLGPTDHGCPGTGHGTYDHGCLCSATHRLTFGGFRAKMRVVTGTDVPVAYVTNRKRW